MSSELPSWFLVAAGLLAGGATGSFAACAWWRLPRRLSLWGASRCPGCERPIPPWLNLPVLGWILLRGRARCCGVKLSPAYLVWEAGCAAAGAMLGLFLGLWVLALPLLAAAAGWMLQLSSKPPAPPVPIPTAPMTSIGSPASGWRRLQPGWAPSLALGALLGLLVGWGISLIRRR